MNNNIEDILKLDISQTIGRNSRKANLTEEITNRIHAIIMFINYDKQ